jgi:hypothetical protein
MKKQPSFKFGQMQLFVFLQNQVSSRSCNSMSWLFPQSSNAQFENGAFRYVQ